MKVLVTGGTGFVGRVVVQSLTLAGHAVRLALRNPLESSSCEYALVGDIGPATQWSGALKGVDAVVHLAARVHVMRDHAGGAEEFRRANTEATIRLGRATVEAGVCRFVFMSTIKVNGEATIDRPFCPNDGPLPTDGYARSKHAAEEGLRNLAGLETVVIRPPLVYGPGAKGNLARLCRLARAGLPVPFGAVRNRRDLVGVANLADLVTRCVSHPAAPGGTFLVSDGQALSTPQLYSMIAEALGRRPRMVSVPVSMLRALALPLGLGGEVDRLTQSLEVDISLTRERLGWHPPFTVRDGIVAMARSFVSDAP